MRADCEEFGARVKYLASDGREYEVEMYHGQFPPHRIGIKIWYGDGNYVNASNGANFVRTCRIFPFDFIQVCERMIANAVLL